MAWTLKWERQQTRTADALSGKGETIFHLQVQDDWGGDYWLHLEVRGGAELYDLDQFCFVKHMPKYTLMKTTAVPCP